MFVLLSLVGVSQETKPTKTIKTIQSPLFYRATIDTSLYLYGNDGRGGMWNRICTYKELGDSIKWYVPYIGALKNVDLGDKKITSTKQQLPIFNGACQISTFLDNGDGSVTIGTGDYHLSTLSTGRGTEKFTLTGGIFVLADNTQNYIVADYNNGSPLIKVITDVNLINETTVVPIYSIYRSGTVLHSQNWDSLGLALANKVHQSIVKTQRYRRESGLGVSEVATRYLSVGSGRVWVGAVPVDISAVITSTDNLRLYYHSGGTWNVSIQTQYNNSQYDNGTNLVSLTANRYAVNWIFRGVESQKHVYVVLGRGDYTLAQAQEAVLPAIPTAISSHAMLIGKLIVQQGATTAISIQSAFDTQFSTATPNAHNDLTGRDVADVHPAGSITFSSTGTISSTTVASAISELDTEKEPLLTKGNLVESVTGLEFSSTRQVIGGSTTLTLTTGYEIPTTTSTNSWTTHVNNDSDLSTTNEIQAPTLVGDNIGLTQTSTTISISGKEDKSNKVTSLSSGSTDTQYPSAKLTYDQLALKQPLLTYPVTENASSFTANKLIKSTGSGDQVQETGIAVDSGNNVTGVTSVSTGDNGIYIGGTEQIYKLSSGSLYIPNSQLLVENGITSYSNFDITNHNINRVNYLYFGNTNAINLYYSGSYLKTDNNFLAPSATFTTGAAANTVFTGDASGNGIWKSLSDAGIQPNLNGYGFVKMNGTTVSYDNSTYEPAFSKNTGFNKNYGTVPGTVLEGRTFGTAANNNTGDFLSSSINPYNTSMSFDEGNRILYLTDGGGTRSVTISQGNIVNCFINTFGVTTSTVSVTWPSNFSDTNYDLDVKHWFTKTINGKNIIVNSAIYDFTKTVSGFSCKLDTVAGYITYRAVNSSNLYPITISNYLSLSGGTMSNTNLVNNLNAEYFNGHNSSYYATIAALSNYVLTASLTTTVGNPGSDSNIPTEKAVRTAILGINPMVYPSAGIAVSTGSTWTTSITDNHLNWDKYNQWDGGPTGLTASTGRTSLGGTTIGQNIFILTNPSAITFPRFNSDNTVTALSAADFRAAIGAGVGTMTSVISDTSPNLGGNLIVNQKNIDVSVTLGSNSTYSGIIETGTVGENVVFGDVLYLKFSDGKWWKAKADAYATTPGVRMAMASISANASGVLLIEGNVRYDSWSFAANKVYLSAATAGSATTTQPSTTGNQIQVLGIAKTSTTMYFKPSNDVGEK